MAEIMRVNLAKVCSAIVIVAFCWGIAWSTATAHERLATVERTAVQLQTENQALRKELQQMNATLNRIETNLDWLMKQGKS